MMKFVVNDLGLGAEEVLAIWKENSDMVLRFETPVDGGSPFFLEAHRLLDLSDGRSLAVFVSDGSDEPAGSIVLQISTKDERYTEVVFTVGTGRADNEAAHFMGA